MGARSALVCESLLECTSILRTSSICAKIHIGHAMEFLQVSSKGRGEDGSC
jgi:hypothetical protein